MPDWFYPLMLVVILAGYVFLFLQGRAARDQVAAMQAQVDDLRRALDRKDDAKPVAGAPEPVAASTAGDPRLDEIQRLVAGQSAALDRLAEGIERLEMRGESGSANGPQAPISAGPPRDGGPEEIARDFLIGEGFASITFTGSTETADGTRLAMRALRGNEVRHGHCIVRDGQVVDAALEVPTTLFP